MSTGLSSACWPWEAGIARRERKKERLERSGGREKGKAAATEKRKERKEGTSQRGLRGGTPGETEGEEKQDESLGKREEWEAERLMKTKRDEQTLHLPGNF